MKHILFSAIGIGAVVLFSTLALSCETTKQAASPAGSGSATAAGAISSASTPVEAVSVVSVYEPVTIKESLDYIDTDITYPRFAGNETLSAAIERAVQDGYPQLKAEALEFKGRNPSSAIKYERITDYEVIEDVTFTNVLLKTYTYTGGAHGLETYQSFVWNKKAQELQNVVQASGMSYDAISARCQGELKTRDFYTGDGWIERGTQADEEHLGTFTIKGKKLTVYFNPYEVAPYAAGVQAVDITLP